MKYAKCIMKPQICGSKKEFEERKMAEVFHVYCLDEMTESDVDNLSIVPLNLIFDCLKYGDYIAILDFEDNLQYKEGTVVALEKAVTKQRPVKLMKADSIEAIDYVFENVSDKKLIHHGYVNNIFMSEKNVDYFKVKMKKFNIAFDF